MRKCKSKLIMSFITVVTMFNFIVGSLPFSARADEKTRIIVSLGDSYSSGEGVEKFYGQDKTLAEKIRWDSYDLDWIAHRSEKSWPGQLTLDGVNGPMSKHRNENWYFVAASGAETKHMGVNEIKGTCNQQKDVVYITGSDDQWEAVHDIFELPYQLHIFDTITNGEVDYVTMTLSGNDVGFVNVLEKGIFTGVDIYKNILFQPNYRIMSENALCINELVEDLNARIDFFDSTVKDNLRKVYYAVQEKAGPQAKIIVAGYPKLLNPDGCVFIFKEICQLINQSVSILNDRLERLVDECREEGLNIFFVSVEGEEYFDGHEAYTKKPYINGFMFLQEQDLNPIANPPISSYSIHPNAEGTKTYAKAVQAELDLLEECAFVSGYLLDSEGKPLSSQNLASIKNIRCLQTKTGIVEIGRINNENGYYEVFALPGETKIEVLLNDGRSFWARNEPLSAGQAENEDPYYVIEAEKRKTYRDININFDEQCLSHVEEPGECGTVVTDGSRLYYCDKSLHLVSFDPQTGKRSDLAEGVYDEIVYQDNMLYYASEDGLCAYDIKSETSTMLEQMNYLRICDYDSVNMNIILSCVDNNGNQVLSSYNVGGNISTIVEDNVSTLCTSDGKLYYVSYEKYDYPNNNDRTNHFEIRVYDFVSDKSNYVASYDIGIRSQQGNAYPNRGAVVNGHLIVSFVWGLGGNAGATNTNLIDCDLSTGAFREIDVINSLSGDTSFNTDGTIVYYGSTELHSYDPVTGIKSVCGLDGMGFDMVEDRILFNANGDYMAADIESLRTTVLISKSNYVPEIENGYCIYRFVGAGGGYAVIHVTIRILNPDVFPCHANMWGYEEVMTDELVLPIVTPE